MRVQVPPDVIVQSEDLYRSLATLSYKLVMKQQGDLSRSPKPAADPAGDCSA